MKSEEIKALCDTLKIYASADEIALLLVASKIKNQGIPTQTIGGGLAYKIGTSKSDTLYNSFTSEINTSKKLDKIFDFIERLASPVRFVGNNEKFNELITSLNKVLIFIGKSISNKGQITEIVRATTLDEADRRLSSMETQFYIRKIHSEVKKYCTKDILKKDYFDMVFEAAKGLFERVREMTGLITDGRKLIQTVFSKNDPHLALNGLVTQTEQDEQAGVQMLFESIAALLRNPRAHTPKVKWNEDENKAMDALTIISFAHKHLDECIVVPRIQKNGGVQ